MSVRNYEFENWASTNQKDRISRIFGMDWMCSIKYGLSIRSSLFVLMYANNVLACLKLFFSHIIQEF